MVEGEAMAIEQPALSAFAQPGAKSAVVGHRDGNESFLVAIAVVGPVGVVAPDGRDDSGGHGRASPSPQIAYAWRLSPQGLAVQVGSSAARGPGIRVVRRVAGEELVDDRLECRLGLAVGGIGVRGLSVDEGRGA